MAASTSHVVGFTVAVEMVSSVSPSRRRIGV